MGSNGTGAGSRKREGGLNLQTAAQFAGWPTPKAGVFIQKAKGVLSLSDQNCENTGGLADAESSDKLLAGQGGLAGGEDSSSFAGFWRDADWLLCRDGRWRPVEPGTFPLVDGASARVGRLRGYGNAIVAPQAEAFIRAFLNH